MASTSKSQKRNITPKEKVASKIPSKKRVTGIKASAKKSARKTKAKQLRDVSAETAFWAVSGAVAYNLSELLLILQSMERRTYDYHAAAGHHDFAVWVSTVLEDKSCATALKKSKTQKEAVAVVKAALQHYSIS